MDSNLQRDFGILVSAIILFIFPIYVAYEKEDDISYALALKITYNFVENVRDKGYLTMDMYDKYVNQLGATNMSYDISMQHVRKQYDPVFYVYTDATMSKIDKKLDYTTNYKYNSSTNTSNYDANTKTLVVNGITYKNVVLSYQESRIINTEKQIFNVLDRQNDIPFMSLNITDYLKTDKNIIPINVSQYEKNVYVMNAGDDFSVQLKNKNKTAASIIFDALTLGANSPNKTRVYVNYGGTIFNDPYREHTDGNYSYIGGMQIYNVDKDGQYKLESWGASDNTNVSSDVTQTSYHKGAYSNTTVSLKAGDVLYIYVGGVGKNNQNGWNSKNPNSNSGIGGDSSIIKNGNQTLITADGGGNNNPTGINYGNGKVKVTFLK